MARRKYLNNTDLLRQLHLSKATYCSYVDPKYIDYHVICDFTEISSAYVAELAGEYGIAEDDIVFRVMDNDHVPDHDEERDSARSRSRAKGMDGKTKVNFQPFVHYAYIDGCVMMVGKSHWKGGLHNGHFSTKHGRLTEELGRMFMKLCEEYARKANWSNYSYRDEMTYNAVAHLCGHGLMFNEAASSNPFAYLTTCINNVFVRTLNTEKAQRKYIDEAIADAGVIDKKAMIAHDVRMAMGEPDPYVVKTVKVAAKPGPKPKIGRPPKTR